MLSPLFPNCHFYVLHFSINTQVLKKMGKSAASFFKIITCASDTVDQDDLQTSQSKVSSDRRGWSFRKRSATHRVLSNTVIAEAPSSASKESPDSTASNFQVQPNSTVPEKNSAIRFTEEKYELSAQTDSKLSDVLVAREDDCREDEKLDEPSIILIQSAIRRYLAQRVLLKQKIGSNTEKHEKKNYIGYCDGKDDVIVPPDFNSESKDIKSAVGPSAGSLENDDSLITYNADSIDPRASSCPQPLNISEPHSSNDLTGSDHAEMKQTNLVSRVEADSLLDKDETGNEQDLPNLEKFYIDQSETEAKGFSGKASNPAFISAQTKSATLTTPSSEDSGVESNLDKVNASSGEPIKNMEILSDDSSTSNASSGQIAGSECGTELSISSTLDSPDRSEAGFNDLEQEPKKLEKANGKVSVLETELSNANINQLVYKSSPEESPRSYMEYQTTPSSQVSVNLKKSKAEKTESNSSKNRSSSGDKRRNSSGSPKPDQEPRDSSSSNSLPSYMQVTKSARAKAISKGSERSSPDVLVKDIFVKKRHSLPAGTYGRQESPLVHRSLPQQQNAKGIEIHSPQERKWRR